MEDKTFVLITKMYDEFSKRFDGIDGRLDGIDSRLDGIDGRLDGIDGRLDGIDNRLDGIDNRLDGIDNRLDGIDNRLKKVEIIIEHDIKNEIRTLFDGYNQVYEAVIERKKSVDRLTKIVEKHDMEISILKKALASSL